jgi:hypothetical protein
VIYNLRIYLEPTDRGKGPSRASEQEEMAINGVVKCPIKRPEKSMVGLVTLLQLTFCILTLPSRNPLASSHQGSFYILTPPAYIATALRFY